MYQPLQEHEIDYSRFIVSTNCGACDRGNHDQCIEAKNRLDKTFTSSRFHCLCFGKSPDSHGVIIQEIKTEKGTKLLVEKNA